MDTRCTVVVNSCDKYEDTWLPFFKIMKKQWADRPYPIVLNTESKTFDYEDMDIKTFSFYKEGEYVPWGKRFIRTLEAIDSEYVLVLLDDFFLLKPVDQQRIEECIRWMDEDPELSVFYFREIYPPNIRDGKYPHFERRPQKTKYKLSCQTGLWRREKLISYIRPHEDPWQWETLGSRRASRYHEKFYSAIEGEPFIMEYIRGGGLHGSKWIKSVVPLFEEYNVQVDFTVRGFKEDAVEEAPKRSFIDRVKGKIRKAVCVWRSLI